MFGVFVVGTDTEVGKTTFSTLFARHLLATGRTVAPFKPIESGCHRDPSGALVPADASQLMDEVSWQLSVDTVCPYRFEAPVTPWVAARMEETEIDLSVIVEHYRWLQTRFDWVIVEGCGGLLSPISRDFDTVSIIQALELPTVIVSRSALGTINHTLLTLKAIRQSGLEPVGVVLNRIHESLTLSEHSNADVIEEFGDSRVLGVIPYASNGDVPRLDWMDELIRELE